MTQNKVPNQATEHQKPNGKPPNDTGSIHVEGFVKIFDPKTQETFVEKRA